MSARKNILVVDDDVDILEQLRLDLERAGYAVTTAESRADAEQLIAQSPPDLAILDLMMESFDAGFVLAHHLKTKCPKVPVIILTSVTAETRMDFDVTTKDEKSWIRADVLMDKPARPEQLRREVARLLGN